jgi:hypothetical protein
MTPFQNILATRSLLHHLTGGGGKAPFSQKQKKTKKLRGL